MENDIENQNDSFGCGGCLLVIIAEVVLLFIALIMATFASDSPRSTDTNIEGTFLVVFGVPKYNCFTRLLTGQKEKVGATRLVHGANTV